MTPREQLDGMMGDLRGEMEALRRENAELRSQIERYKEDGCFTPAVTCSDYCSLLQDARDRVMRECEEIAKGEKVNAEETQALDDFAYNTACDDIAEMIARAREEGK